MQNNKRWKTINIFAANDLADSIDKILSSIEKPPFHATSLIPHPLTFLAYKNLVDALNMEDDLVINQNVSYLSNSLRLKRPLKPTLFEWQNNIFSEKEWENIALAMAIEPIFPIDLEKPTEITTKQCQVFLDKSLSFLETHSLPYYELVEEMLKVIILATPGDKSQQQGLSFGGATYFFLWGATIINPLGLKTLPRFLEQLVHEACHMALFAICHERGVLCTNSDSSKFSSAFRSDTRPMHGLIHAYFVAKNIETCFLNLSSSTYYLQEFKGFIETTSNASKLLFLEIKKHAELTPLGESILRTPEITHVKFLK